MENPLGQKTSGFLFSLMLVLTLFVLTFTTVSEYTTVTGLIQEQMEGLPLTPETFNKADYPSTKQYYLELCENNRVTVQTSDRDVLELRCNDLESANDSDDFFELLTIEKFSQVYYQKHDCNFFSCMFSSDSQADKITYLVSNDAHEFYTSVYWPVIGATAVAGVIFAFFSGGFFSISRNFGWAYASIGTGFVITFIFDRLLPAFSFTGQALDISSPVMKSIISQLNSYLIVYFIAGALLVLTGYIGDYIVSIKYKK